MTEGITHARFEARETFVNSSCTPNNGVLDFTKLGPCIDAIRPFLGPNLENKIRSMLEEFVCSSDSRCAKRFPRAKKFFDAVAAWADCLDASIKDTDVKQRMIKHAIEYLARNGLVTQIADPVTLNCQANKADPDSLAAQQNVARNMNVWRFINEKDYWLCQDCVTSNSTQQNINSEDEKCRKETSGSDLDVEVGSISQEPSTFYSTCRTTSVRGSFCHQKVENTKSQIKPNCRNAEFIFEPNKNPLNPPIKTRTIFDDTNCCSTIENFKKFDTKARSDCDTRIDGKKFIQTQTSFQDVTFIFKPAEPKIPFHFQSTLNRPNKTCNVTNTPKPLPRKGNLKNLDTTTNCDHNRNTYPKNSKLKIYVHKTTSVNCSKVRDPPKVSNLSLPCKSSQLIVRLFEADPSLSDSCLILMRKKFEKNIHNACSCMNDILKKLDDSTIKRLRLNCEIRPGRVDLNLLCKDGGTSKVRWFLGRVPICSNVHKRDSCHESGENCESSTDRCGEARCSKDLPVDPGCCRDVTRRGEEFEERRVAFYSVCSNHSLTEEKRTCESRNEIGSERRGKEVNFIWSREKERQVDFVFSSRFIDLQRNEDSVLSFRANINDKCDETLADICDRSGLKFLNEEKERMTEEPQEIVNINEKSETYCDRLVAEDSEHQIIELCNCRCNCSSDSLRDDVCKEDYSTTGGCNPQQCFCHVFCSNDTSNNDQRTNVLVTYPEEECLNEEDQNEDRRVDCFYCLEENISRIQEHASRTEECASKMEDGISAAKNTSILDAEKKVCMVEENIFVSKHIASQAENNCKLETGIYYPKEKEESTLDVKEIYSVDSIRGLYSNSTDLSCDTKCSCCGQDLSSPSLDEKVNIENKNPINASGLKTLPDLETRRTSNLIVTENAATSEYVKNSTIVRSSKFNLTSNISIKSVTSLKQSSKTTDNNLIDFPRKYPENPKQNSIEHTPGQETVFINLSNSSKLPTKKDPSITESLFVFCRGSNAERSSSTSSSSTDEKSCSSKNFHKKSNETHKRSGPPCKRTVQKSCHRKSIYSTYTCAQTCSTRNLRPINSSKRNAKHGIKKEDSVQAIPDVPRYKNRSWRRSMIPGSLCSSFPAIDRIKYLIRKKLRKLLLEERDKGTGTSKTFLRNDRYLVSISSGKLNDGRTTRESCSAGSSIRCPFTARNRYETAAVPEKTFTEGSSSAKNRNAFGDIVKARYRRMIQGNDAFRKMRMAEFSRSSGARYRSKSTDTRDLIGEKGEIIGNDKLKAGNKQRFSINYSIDNRILSNSIQNRIQKNRSNIVPMNSGGISFLEDRGDHSLNRRPCHEKNPNSEDIKFLGAKNLSVDTKSMKNCTKRNYDKRGSPGIWFESEKNGTEGGTEERTCCDKLKSFEKRLFKLERKHEEDNNFASFLSDYEKRVNELDADFRLKLLQYVALCRSVKNSLMKRLQSDDVYEVSSSSV